MTALRFLLVTLLAGLSASELGHAQGTDEEQQLRDIQQALARAWLQKDRAYIEGVLASEWTVTQPDGQVLTRATVLGSFFDSVHLDSNVVDDVAVMLFGTTAVVRGRTVAAGTLNGAPVNARIRFTDVFLKRNGRWQAAASHASPLQDTPSPQAASPLTGHWTANIEKSTLSPTFPVQRASLELTVDGDTVTAAGEVVLASGQAVRQNESFTVDGQPHAFERSPLGPGVIVVARWLSPSTLETDASQNGRPLAVATYEVSGDGQTLTARTTGMVEQVLVFERK